MLYDRTLIQIRRRSFLDLLDMALVIARARPLILGLAALAGIAPWAALNVWLLGNPAFQRMFWFALLLMESPWATAPLCLVLGDLMFGARIRAHRVAWALVRSLPALLVSQLLVRGLLLGFVVMYPVMPARYAFLNEAILLERVGLLQAFRRCRTLTSGMEGEMFMRWLGQIFLGSVFAICFWMSAETMFGSLAGNDLTWYQPGLSDIRSLVFQAAVWIAIAFFGVYRFLAYIDRRIRLEGWELELRLKDVGRSLEERPW